MKIIVKLESRAGFERDVLGEIVDIAPHLASVATFVVHKNPYISYRSWQITNVESGLGISGFGKKTKAQSIDSARLYLRDKTVDGVLNAYKEAKVK